MNENREGKEEAGMGKNRGDVGEVEKGIGNEQEK